MLKLHSIFNPGVYHGPGRGQNFFEGWYYKIADKEGKNLCAVIPAIFLNKNEEDRSHSFVQIHMDNKQKPFYHKFSREDFAADSKKFRVEIGDNYFSRKRIELNINNRAQKIAGELEFSQLKPWPVKILSPGAMGWYAYMPFMECYHGVLSFDHKIEGQLCIDGKTYDFSGGRGYLEKDWGKSFPEAWVWLQCNHFKEKGTSLFASLAMVPWRGEELRGFIVGLWRRGKFYTFTTYNRAKLDSVKISKNDINMKLSKNRYQLKIEAAGSDWVKLFGPYREKMKQNVRESLSAEIFVVLEDKKRDKELFFGHSYKAGLEINGELKKLNNPSD